MPLDYEDPVDRLVHCPDISFKDIEALCASFEPDQAKDVYTAYRILTTLQQHLGVTKSWKFTLLSVYEFQSQARDFDTDLAVVVARQAERMLRKVNSWGIEQLKAKIAQIADPSMYTNDASSVLTVLVLRILTVYAELEFKLNLALSRSTLIRMHSDLEDLLPHIAKRSGSHNGKVLVERYRMFVTQLLVDLESAPGEDVQQELFQIVRDLHGMFVKFARSHQFQSSLLDNENVLFTEPSSPASSVFSSPGGSLENSWTSDFIPDYKHRGRAAGGHHRTLSNASSSLFSSFSNKTSITEDLPSIMHAFEAEKHKQPPQPPSLPHSPSIPRNLPFYSSILGSFGSSSSPVRKDSRKEPQKLLGGPIPENLPLVRAYGPVPPQEEQQTIQVKMVGSRAKVIIPGSNRLMDLQDWTNMMNNSSKRTPSSSNIPLPPTLKKTAQPPAKPQPIKRAPLMEAFSSQAGPAGSTNKPSKLKFEQNYVDAMDNF
ncbi:hypothetical protein TRVA0_020S01090 [Trichomonascus vanleenenianus]|uniref:uncharacterized protein n=1 Tax=Trichomonascus vanleenenianus TaxID=2268995 RepID=UPI003EC9C3E9